MSQFFVGNARPSRVSQFPVIVGEAKLVPAGEAYGVTYINLNVSANRSGRQAPADVIVRVSLMSGLEEAEVALGLCISEEVWEITERTRNQPLVEHFSITLDRNGSFSETSDKGFIGMPLGPFERDTFVAFVAVIEEYIPLSSLYTEMPTSQVRAQARANEVSKETLHDLVSTHALTRKHDGGGYVEPFTVEDAIDAQSENKDRLDRAIERLRKGANQAPYLQASAAQPLAIPANGDAPAGQGGLPLQLRGGLPSPKRGALMDPMQAAIQYVDQHERAGIPVPVVPQTLLPGTDEKDARYLSAMTAASRMKLFDGTAYDDFHLKIPDGLLESFPEGTIVDEQPGRTVTKTRSMTTYEMVEKPIPEAEQEAYKTKYPNARKRKIPRTITEEYEDFDPDARYYRMHNERYKLCPTCQEESKDLEDKTLCDLSVTASAVRCPSCGGIGTDASPPLCQPDCELRFENAQRLATWHRGPMGEYHYDPDLRFKLEVIQHEPAPEPAPEPIEGSQADVRADSAPEGLHGDESSGAEQLASEIEPAPEPPRGGLPPRS